jgi:Outer membrane protein beta-barrel domain
MRTTLSLAALPLLAVTTTASAQPGDLHAASEPRHVGLFLRVTPGVAASAATAEVDGNELSLRGGAGRLGIAAGWAISPRVILAVELLGHAVLGPELESDGMTTTTDDDVVWGVSYAGVGLNYYLPSNLYLGASLGTMMMTLETSGMDTAETDLGFGLKAGVGYEWWVASKVGLGVGVELLAGSVDDGDARWGVATLGLAFSATYN